MKREIRNLLSGEYRADDDNCILEIYRTDAGTHIVNVDIALDIYHHWVLDVDGKVIDFEMGSAFEVEL